MIKNKYIFMVLLFIVVSLAGAGTSLAIDYQNLYEISFPDQKPFIDENNRTLIPVRFVTEQLGGIVRWDSAERKVYINQDEKTIILTAGSTQAIKIEALQSTIFNLDTKAVLVDGRIMVPLRFLSEIMGSEVTWDQRLRSVILNQQMVINLSGRPLNLSNATALQSTAVSGANIEAVRTDRSLYYAGNQVRSFLTINPYHLPGSEIWIQANFTDPTGKNYSDGAVNKNLPAGQHTGIEITWMVPENVLSGEYKVSYQIWDRSPSESNARVLDKKDLENTIRIYRGIDTFTVFDQSMWRKSSHMLEGTKLEPHNVNISNGKLLIHLPKGELTGGELQSRQRMGFGSYEIRMKVPDVPSSITGFFLYRSPTLHHEIDIEIYNEPSRGYFLTTYSDGKKQNLFESTLPFDPTAGFHNYRIDYYPDVVRFYIDGNMVKEWRDGFSNQSMSLMINAWYPDWLGKKPARSDDKFLEVDWIRY